jgi:uncharacterized cupredoxin-like copper-binding protein
MSRTPSLLTAATLAVALLVTGCGSDEEAAQPVTGAPTTEAETTTTTAPAPHEGDIEVVARDFAFEDLPARVVAGPHTVRFDNQGTETHELFVFRNPDGLTLEEIAELGPEGAPQAVELAGLVIVEPGKADEVEVDLAPGDYEVACFIPTPTDGRAHFEHGMHARFTVE